MMEESIKIFHIFISLIQCYKFMTSKKPYKRSVSFYYFTF